MGSLLRAVCLRGRELTGPPWRRENALAELSKKRESFPELAPYLWHSFGVIACLLQEILAVYPCLSPPTLSAHASNRVCNALALLQCVASHPETRGLFLTGKRARSGSRPFRWAHSADLGPRCSAHPPVPVPLPQLHLQEPAL